MSMNYSDLSAAWAGQSFQTKGSGLNLLEVRYSRESQEEAEFYGGLVGMGSEQARYRFEMHLREQLGVGR